MEGKGIVFVSRTAENLGAGQDMKGVKQGRKGFSERWKAGGTISS